MRVGGSARRAFFFGMGICRVFITRKRYLLRVLVYIRECKYFGCGMRARAADYINSVLMPVFIINYVSRL